MNTKKLITLLIPVIVDAATGDWKRLETKQINVMLEKEEN